MSLPSANYIYTGPVNANPNMLTPTLYSWTYDVYSECLVNVSVLTIL